VPAGPRRPAVGWLVSPQPDHHRQGRPLVLRAPPVGVWPGAVRSGRGQAVSDVPAAVRRGCRLRAL